jgi:predicted RNase H-like HicB family nuclease
MRKIQLTRVIEKEGDGYVALCPELDIASQGDTVAEARKNLVEAIEGFLEVASEQELKDRLSAERYVENIEVTLA